MHFKKRGFTMVELLVVLIILGILVAVAAPMYLANVRRARASEAVAAMGLIRQAEREYRTNHDIYLTVTNITADLPTGLGIDVGTAQYFSNAAYSVTVNATSARFTNPAAVEFIIYADGSASAPCNATTNCAVRNGEVSGYRLEMDNSGRTYVRYSTNATWGEW